MRFVGIALWVVSSVAAFFIARMLPWRRRRSWLAELCAAILSGLIFGVIATALDFGGWKELEWRAALFVFFGACATVALVRLTMPPTSERST
jgi:hypothetical protein